ncbi:MAG: hypothetical protein C4307_05245, partial [Chloroflexota bacterium]
PRLEEIVRSRYPRATQEAIERVQALVAGYCSSSLACRLSSLPGLVSEQPFAFEHEGVLLHGRLDVLHVSSGRALVVDFKTNALAGTPPARVVEDEYRTQRLVYALACLRAGAEEVEVVYQFLEQPEDTVWALFSRADLPRLERDLSAEIARIREGRFPPRPSEIACSGCPVLDVVCAGPRLAHG